MRDNNSNETNDDLPDLEDIEFTPERQAAILRGFQTPTNMARLGEIARSFQVNGLAGVQRKILDQARQPMADLAKKFTATYSADLAKRFAWQNSAGLAERMIKASGVNGAAIAGLLSQPSWQERYGTISSDIFKSVALTQGRLDSIGAELVKNAQLGEAATRAMEAFAAQQKSIWESLGPSLARMRNAFYPPNLRDVDGLTYQVVEEVAMVDGIAIYGLPRPAIVEALIGADGAQKRREVLGRRWQQILVDCREVVDGLDPDLRHFARTATLAIDALEAGHVEAAQSLSATLVDSFLRERLEQRDKYMPSRSGNRTTAAYEELGARQFIAFAPIWQAYQTYPKSNGDPVPTTFSRHASAHTVSRRQFNRRNAVQCIMLACSLLYHLDEQIAARSAA